MRPASASVIAGPMMARQLMGIIAAIRPFFQEGPMPSRQGLKERLRLQDQRTGRLKTRR